MVIATDRRQARNIFQHIDSLLSRVPLLKQKVRRRTGESIELSNGIRIEVQTADFRAVRGYTIVAALCDEIAFWRSDGTVNPDSEILAAIKPAMATVPNAMMLCASSPYAQRGVLYEAFKENYGNDDSRVLVWRADTRTMNPTVPQSFIDEEYTDDPESARSEYGAEFRRDIEAFVTREAAEACVIPGVLELPPSGSCTYEAFVDPSGGSQDSMTLAIGHRRSDNDHLVIDCTRERKPRFSPDDVVREFAVLMNSYGLSSVTGDYYGGEWPRDRFSDYGIRYEIARKTKSDLYRDRLPLINSRRIELLDNPDLVGQLVGLVSRTSRAGRDSITHSPGGRDDLINAVAGVASIAQSGIVMIL